MALLFILEQPHVQGLSILSYVSVANSHTAQWKALLKNFQSTSEMVKSLLMLRNYPAASPPKLSIMPKNPMHPGLELMKSTFKGSRRRIAWKNNFWKMGIGADIPAFDLVITTQTASILTGVKNPPFTSLRQLLAE
ncbi:hypothetical protein HAX54_031099 [Datura stramonium]|uniref:Uncharacterized protein n=1 Tax=Datura stramonium TaxID=4076 RepID=A0ABS8V8N4_DATST|nr:hypothetical protein [Datura stramonium]